MNARDLSKDKVPIENKDEVVGTSFHKYVSAQRTALGLVRHESL